MVFSPRASQDLYAIETQSIECILFESHPKTLYIVLFFGWWCQCEILAIFHWHFHRFGPHLCCRLCRLFDEKSIAKQYKYLRGMERFQKFTKYTMMCVDKRKKTVDIFSCVCVLCARESQSNSIQISWIIFSANISLSTDVDFDQ